MSSLLNLAINSFNSAKMGLNTTSHNISNHAVKGYSRQTPLFAQASVTHTGQTFSPSGVTVTGNRREYDELIANQLRKATTTSSSLNIQHEYIANIDRLLANSPNSLSGTMDNFFSSLQHVVNNTNDASARQTVLEQAKALVSQFRRIDHTLKESEQQINDALNASAKQINHYAQQISLLNRQISQLTTPGVEPNDLLDQRDQLVNELSEIVDVTVSRQNSHYNITLGKGISLVSDDVTYELVAIPSRRDPTRITLGYIGMVGEPVEIAEKMLPDGVLGGMLAFRQNELAEARNRLGQMALVFANSINTQHCAGVDSNGHAGVNIFAFGSATVIGNNQNRSNTIMRAKCVETYAVQATDYRANYDGTQWHVIRLSDRNEVKITVHNNTASSTLNFDGLEVSTIGIPEAQDSFLIKPVSNVIVDLDLIITDEAKIAAAVDKGGVSGNRNAQQLLNLQSGKFIEGNQTFSEAYASLVAQVGNKTANLKNAADVQASVVAQLTQRQQSVSGVNLDEEYINLEKFKEFFQSIAKIVNTQKACFEALMNIF